MPHPVTPNFWRRVKFYLKKCLQSPPFSFMAINWVKVSKNATSKPQISGEGSKSTSKNASSHPPFSFMAINWVKVSKNATSSHPKFLENGQILPQKMPPVTPILIHGHKLGQSLKKCHIQTPNFWRRVKVYLKKCHIQSPPFSFMAINWVKVSKNATSSHPKFLEKGQILPQKMPPVTPILIHGHKLGQSLKKCHIQSPKISGEWSNSTSKNASSHPHSHSWP